MVTFGDKVLYYHINITKRHLLLGRVDVFFVFNGILWKFRQLHDYFNSHTLFCQDK